MSGTVLDSGRYIAFVVDIVATVIVRIGWISKMSGMLVLSWALLNIPVQMLGCGWFGGAYCGESGLAGFRR